MRYLIRPSQIDFFRENGYIAFEEIIATEKAMREKTPSTSFSLQHNLFQRRSCFKTLATSRRLAHIALSLSGKKHIRLLFDQGFFQEDIWPSTFQENSSFQGLQLFAFLRLSPEKKGSTDRPEEANGPILPHGAGSALFFKPNVPFSIEKTLDDPADFLLIAYGDINTLYVKNPLDPLAKSPHHISHKLQPGDPVPQNLAPLLL